jgi:hypothetical protein
MQFTRNTSTRPSKNKLVLLIKLILILIAIFVIVIALNKIEFPAPSKTIEKIISNENLKIVK